MEFNNFALSSMKIKSNWFDVKGKNKSVFQRIKKEEGLNLYLQLFRFRLHQGKYDEHVFRVTIDELKKFTKINCKTKLRNNQVYDLLKDMSKAGIIKLHKPTRWDYLLDEKGRVKPDDLIVLQATDVPLTYKSEKNEDTPVTENDHYIPINFKTIEYIYNDLTLTSKELSVYLLLMKLSSGGRQEAFMNINKMKKWLGYGNDTIIDIIKVLNRNYLVASHSRNIGKSVSFYHTPLRSYSQIEAFKEEMGDTIKTFLRRYGEQIEDENIEENPFSNLDDDWGVSPY